MLATLGILSVMPLIYMGKFEPMAFFDDNIDKATAGLSRLKTNLPEGIANVVAEEKVQVYKWRDKHGVMQFSHTSPPTVHNAEAMLIDPNKNLIKAIKSPKREEAKTAVTTQTASPYSVSGMQKVMNEASGVENLLNSRHQQQQKMLDGL